MEDRVKIEITDGVADIKFVRTDKMNALDGKMFNAIVAAGERMKTEPGVRAVVLSGEGRAFCAGLDTGSIGAMASGAGGGGEADLGDGGQKAERKPLSHRDHGIANHPQYAAWVWREVPVPVIAAVHGVSFGGGFQIALGADVRYAAPGTRFAVMEMKWGLVPDMAGIALMRHLARDDVIRELTYSARVFEADEAQDLGFVTRVCDDPYEAAMATAKAIAGRNPHAVRAAKRLLNGSLDHDAADVLMQESVEQQEIIGKPNQIEAIMAELEKRPGNFAD